jgi:hypothetical protein
MANTTATRAGRIILLHGASSAGNPLWRTPSNERSMSRFYTFPPTFWLSDFGPYDMQVDTTHRDLAEVAVQVIQRWRERAAGSAQNDGRVV